MKRAITSASNIFRRQLCPGSARKEAGFAEVESEYSGEGAMLHTLFLTGQRPETLTVEQGQALDLADFYANEFFGNLRQRFDIPMEAEYIDERDLSLMLYSPKGKELFPGHADVIRTWPEYNVRGIVDAKFGFLSVEFAPSNLQLASYIAMRQQMSPAKALGACITQPRNFGPRMTQAGYNADKIPGVVLELEKILRESEKPDAPLNAGEKQCHFCKAKTDCEAYRAKFSALEEPAPVAITTLPADKLEALHSAITFANKIKDEVNDEMRRRIEEGTLPGWKLQNSGDDVTLNDAVGFFNAIREYFPADKPLTPKLFDDCRSMEWGRLTAVVQQRLLLSEKKAKELLAKASEPFTTRKRKKMKVVRDKTAGALPA